MKSARPNTWMPMYWSDYWAKTAHLSPLEHCAYFHLIGAYWERGGPLANDEDALARIGRLTKAEWKKARGAVLAFFTETDGELHHNRIDEELATAKESYDRRVERSAKANKERHKDSNKDSNKETDKGTDKVSNEDTQAQAQVLIDLKTIVPDLRATRGQARSKEWIKQRWEQKISQDIIEGFGPERGMEIIERYQAGDPDAKKLFNEISNARKVG